MDESTFPLKDCLLSVVVCPTVCVFKWFHTNFVWSAPRRRALLVEGGSTRRVVD